MNTKTKYNEKNLSEAHKTELNFNNDYYELNRPNIPDDNKLNNPVNNLNLQIKNNCLIKGNN